MIDAVTTEAHTVIAPLTRQVRRQIERRAAKHSGVRCRRCPDPVTDPATACLDNGQVSHAECAERINDMVDQMNNQQAAVRLEQAGIVLAKPNLIVPGS